jgi:hypothetical protein
MINLCVRSSEVHCSLRGQLLRSECSKSKINCSSNCLQFFYYCLSENNSCNLLFVQAPMVRPYCFVPFLFLSWDGWCLVIAQGVCLGIAYAWFASPFLITSNDVWICYVCLQDINFVLLTFPFIIITMNNYLASTLPFEQLARAQLLIFCIRLAKLRYTISIVRL